MLLQRFRRDNKGSVAPMFALAIVPVVGFVGAAIDYSRASSTRADLQAALDAAALIIFRDAATSTSAQLDQKALDAVKAQFTRADAQGLTVKANYTTSPASITVTGSTSIQSDFMRLIGVPTIKLGTSSTVTWGFSKLRVALALDNTGSMGFDGKIDALKTATHGLLSQLKTASKTAGDMQVAIVPFSKDVNVGTSKQNASWLDWTSWDASNGSWCRRGNCSNSYQNNYTWTPDSHSTWNGCVTDRNQNYDVNVTAPTSTSTAFSPEQYGLCPVSMMGLGYDWTALDAKVDAMYPNGSTNQTIGLVWAWHALTPTAPMNAPAIDTTGTTQQYIILLSDGLNTQDRWYGNGSDVSSQVDARMALVCANAKAAGIQIYTVQVNTGGDPTSTVLKNCASSADKFYELKSATAIVSTFNTIASQLAALRISK